MKAEGKSRTARTDTAMSAGFAGKDRDTLAALSMKQPGYPEDEGVGDSPNTFLPAHGQLTS
jgi:hypothetical protein